MEIQALSTNRDQPIAADLGTALTALPTAQADRVLGALLETTEPTILAQVLTHAPRIMRERIEKQIGEISLADAGEIRSLPRFSRCSGQETQGHLG
jgi:hypothetical protein